MGLFFGANSQTGIDVEMVFVEGGTFTMGCTSEQKDDCYDWEKPAHRVTLNSYYMGKYEVTQAQWKAVMGENNNPSFLKRDDLPVTNITWEEAQVFIRKLNEKMGKNYRLPTEAEWEYAARGGTQSQNYKYSGSNNVDLVAWYEENSGDKPHPVGTKSPNELDIYDMSGNVWEWCSDWYDDYRGTSQTNPQGPSSGSYRVARGGGWYYDAKGVRVSIRSDNTPDDRYDHLGFRLARSSE
jgi:formylglycine-generating enzyme required for sulfatase activity